MQKRRDSSYVTFAMYGYDVRFALLTMSTQGQGLLIRVRCYGRRLD